MTLPTVQSWKLMRAAWRADAESRLQTLSADLDVAGKLEPTDPRVQGKTRSAKDNLEIVEKVLTSRPTLRQQWRGADIECAWANLHEVEAILLELTDPGALRGALPYVQSLVERFLTSNDPERVQVTAMVMDKRALDVTDRKVLVNAVRSAQRVRAEQYRRVRSFRNTLLATAAVLIVFAALIGLFGFLSPSSVNLCFDQQVCPTGTSTPARGDMFVVELLGVLGAMIVGALAIRRMRGTSTPYAVPLASLLVKVPTGALTAVGGILLLKAGFVAGVSYLSAGGIGAYSFLFGASQQTVTQLVDRQAQTVLNDVASADRRPGSPGGK